MLKNIYFTYIFAIYTLDNLETEEYEKRQKEKKREREKTERGLVRRTQFFRGKKNQYLNPSKL